MVCEFVEWVGQLILFSSGYIDREVICTSTKWFHFVGLVGSHMRVQIMWKELRIQELIHKGSVAWRNSFQEVHFELLHTETVRYISWIVIKEIFNFFQNPKYICSSQLFFFVKQVEKWKVASGYKLARCELQNVHWTVAWLCYWMDCDCG